MTAHIALLRAINVGGHASVAMSDLRGMCEELGLTDARSLLQTGNLVFKNSRRTSAGLEQLLEGEAKRRLDLATDFFVRTATDWAGIIARNPFPEEAKSDPSHLVVQLLKDAPPAKAVKDLQASIRGPELVRADGKQLYVVYPAGIGRSKLTAKLMEDKLGIRATGRNWNTVLKLNELAQA